MNAARSIVLVGGSGLGPWAWERVTPLLAARGFDVVTPQLRATGDDTTPAADVTMSDWIDDVSDAVAGSDVDAVTLVAHSFAGYVAAGALARDGGRIGTAVFLDAMLPEPGTSWFDAMGPSVEQFMAGIADCGAVPWFTSDQLDQLHPMHGIGEVDLRWMRSKLTAQPLSTYSASPIARPFDPGRAGCVYVRCLRTTPPAADITDDSPDWTLRTLDTGHWPMITDPVATAALLAELAAT